MERDQAVRLTQNLLKKMVEKEGSDLFLTSGFPPAIKVDGTIHKATDAPLSPDQSAMNAAAETCVSMQKRGDLRALAGGRNAR